MIFFSVISNNFMAVIVLKVMSSMKFKNLRV